MTAPFESLDPVGREETRATAHPMIDFAIAHLAGVRERPVRREMPASVRADFRTPPPEIGQPREEVCRELWESLLPCPMGNIHPRFWMWYMGTGSFTGALAEFLAPIEILRLGAALTRRYGV